MLEYNEIDQVLLWHPLTEAGPIPPVQDPDGIYPYVSFAETSHRPVLKRFRFAVLENDFVRAVVCPDLGAKVHSLQEKNSGREVLFVPACVQPVRILPRLGFIAGGIEVSFPISHSPVQLERVEYKWGRAGDRVYLSCGERELHFGLHWTVEYSLGPKDEFLTQRTCFHNPSLHAPPWMSWSNAALPARPDTQFHFPGGPVLRHGDHLSTIDWNSQGPRQLSDLKRMTGFFWQQRKARRSAHILRASATGCTDFGQSGNGPGYKTLELRNGQRRALGPRASRWRVAAISRFKAARFAINHSSAFSILVKSTVTLNIGGQRPFRWTSRR